jgi:hypothetical protein
MGSNDRRKLGSITNKRANGIDFLHGEKYNGLSYDLERKEALLNEKSCTVDAAST